MPIAQKVEFSLFLIFFFLLVLFPRKPMADYLSRSALVSDVTFLMVQLLAVLPLYPFSQMGRISWFSFWPSFLFIFFLKWAESHSAGSKVLCCYSPFYSPLFWFPEIPSTCAVRGHSRFSSFSCWISSI